MGRRKIEIKAIKDDRNRSVTFLKRKGGLFKKAHELSVLCSVDVAVFIFGSNKKLYEYSSGDMPTLIQRYHYHGGPNEHKGPSDFNGGADDDEDDDENGTPPLGDGMDPNMLPPHFAGQPPYQHIRHHTPSASPPIPNGVFGPHPGHQVPRGHTPQPQIGSRPSSRNDIRRMGPNMVPQPVGPPGPPQPPAVNGFAFMPQPAIYNPQNQPSMPPNMGHPMAQGHPQYQYPPQANPHQMQPYMENPRTSMPPNYPPQQAHAPPAPRHSVSPPQPQPQQLPGQPIPHMSPPPQPHHQPMPSPPQPQHQSQTHLAPPPLEHHPGAIVEVKHERVVDGARQPLLLDTVVKKLPPRKGGSIFTPIDDSRSMLAKHLAAFHDEPQQKQESDVAGNRSQSLDVGTAARSKATNSPPLPQRANTTQTQAPKDSRNGSLSSIPETAFTPPSRSNSIRLGSGAPRPRLKVQIPPDEPSDAGSATAESASPRGTSTDATSQHSRRATDSHSSGNILPPPSPSASALLSAGATGPPNPFARPPPHQNNTTNSNMNIDTPVSALPSRFLNNEFLPSPSSFYPEWNFRGGDNNTLPSPLNFATPVVGTGPSFLRDDATPHKRKSPEITGAMHEGMDVGNEPKRVKVDS